MEVDEISAAIGAHTVEVAALRREISAHAEREERRLDKMESRLAAIEGCLPRVRSAMAEWRKLKSRGVRLLIGAGSLGILGGAAAEHKSGWVKAAWVWFWG
jgi:hypothetical protein